MVPITSTFSSFAYFLAFASSNSRVVFSSLARMIASASPLSINFSSRTFSWVFLIFLVSIQSILSKIIFSCSFAVISVYRCGNGDFFEKVFQDEQVVGFQ
jgi:hypothetical protein